MSLSAVPQPTFWQSLPFCVGTTFEKTYSSQEAPGDWCTITVKKLDEDGKPLNDLHRYVMENSTGDLYGMQDKLHGPPTRFTVAVKSGGICLITSFYAVLLVVWEHINLLADLSEIILKAPGNLAKDYQTKGVISALCNMAVVPLCQAACSFAEYVAQVAKAPIFAIGLIFASFYGIFIPFEGMKQISQIESAWHGGATYKSDVRYKKGGSYLCTTLFEDFKSARSGSVLFLGYCMQKRGNIDELIKGKKRFTLVDQSSREA